MTEFDYSNLKESLVISLFDRGIRGWKFSPAFRLDGHENQLRSALGPHNAAAHFYRSGEAYCGVDLRCQCSACLGQQCVFCMDKKVDIRAQQVGGLSRTRVGPNEVTLERRHECVFEEKTLEEKAEKEQRQRRQTRMQELIKMSEEQQARLMNDQPITGEAESDEANKLG